MKMPVDMLRDAVATEHQLGAEGGQPAQGGGPVDGVALHLLRVAGVGGDAEEQVAGAEDPLFGEPADHVVVGLAAVVGELESQAVRRPVHIPAASWRIEEVTTGPLGEMRGRSKSAAAVASWFRGEIEGAGWGRTARRVTTTVKMAIANTVGLQNSALSSVSPTSESIA